MRAWILLLCLLFEMSYAQEMTRLLTLVNLVLQFKLPEHDIQEIADLLDDKSDLFTSWFNGLKSLNDVPKLHKMIESVHASETWIYIKGTMESTSGSFDFKSMIRDFIRQVDIFMESNKSLLKSSNLYSLFSSYINGGDDGEYFLMIEEKKKEIEDFKFDSSFKEKLYDFAVADFIHNIFVRSSHPESGCQSADGPNGPLTNGQIAVQLLIFGQAIQNASPQMQRIFESSVARICTTIPEMEKFMKQKEAKMENSSSETPPKSEMSQGIKILIGVGSVIAVLVVAGLVVWLYFRARKVPMQPGQIQRQQQVEQSQRHDGYQAKEGNGHVQTEEGYVHV